MSKLLFPVHEDDPKPIKAYTRIKQGWCLHCGQRIKPGEKVSYTELSSGRIIWWHQHHPKISDEDSSYGY